MEKSHLFSTSKTWMSKFASPWVAEASVDAHFSSKDLGCSACAMFGSSSSKAMQADFM
jgi:hypothetical protein